MSTEPPPEATYEEVMEKLSSLLPLFIVNVRTSGIVAPFVRSLAIKKLSDALEKGYLIDRTNSDGPLEEWDGWLVIDTPGSQTFIQTSCVTKLA